MGYKRNLSIFGFVAWLLYTGCCSHNQKIYLRGQFSYRALLSSSIKTTTNIRRPSKDYISSFKLYNNTMSNITILILKMKRSTGKSINLLRFIQLRNRRNFLCLSLNSVGFVMETPITILYRSKWKNTYMLSFAYISLYMFGFCNYLFCELGIELRVLYTLAKQVHHHQITPQPLYTTCTSLFRNHNSMCHFLLFAILSNSTKYLQKLILIAYSSYFES